MTAKEFFYSHAGKGTVGVALTALLFAWPPAASWIAASIALCFGVYHLREAFRRIDEASSIIELPDKASPTVIRVTPHREQRACDMDEVMAALSASSQTR